MTGENKLSATRSIWAGFFFGLAVINANVLFAGQTPAIENVIMTVTVAIATTVATIAVWTSNSPSSDSEVADTKLKRGERVKRLIDLMDEDELYALRERLSTEYSENQDEFVVLGTDGEIHRKQKSS